MRLTDITLTNSEIIRIVDENVHNERNRALLKGRYVDGRTIDELSRQFELSNEAVKKIIRKSDAIFT